MEPYRNSHQVLYWQPTIVKVAGFEPTKPAGTGFTDRVSSPSADAPSLKKSTQPTHHAESRVIETHPPFSANRILSRERSHLVTLLSNFLAEGEGVEPPSPIDRGQRFSRPLQSPICLPFHFLAPLAGFEPALSSDEDKHRAGINSLSY